MEINRGKLFLLFDLKKILFRLWWELYWCW